MARRGFIHAQPFEDFSHIGLNSLCRIFDGRRCQIDKKEYERVLAGKLRICSGICTSLPLRSRRNTPGIVTKTR